MTREGAVIESMFRIADKEGRDVDFILNDAQRRLDHELTQRNIIPKARQEGISSYILARFTVSCLAHRNTRAVVISHDQESTQRMLKRVQYYIENIKGPAPVIKNMSANEITFPKMNSMFYIGTAGSRRFGRGDTITHLHCSEYAYWPSPRQLMQGLLQAVPVKTGEVFIESTGNGLNDYYRRCMRAHQGKSFYKLLFFPWHTFPEYTLEMSQAEEEMFLASLSDDLDELRLATKLTAGQLAWRRLKLEELDFDVGAFRQEYPMTLDECFQMSGRSVFHRVRYSPTERWEKTSAHGWTLKGHPQSGMHYVLGADVAAGVGQNSSAIEVVCLETMEQVAEYSNDRIDPEAFAFEVARVGGEFNDAFCVVEQNNHGILTLSVLEKEYPQERIYRTPTAATTGEERSLFKLGYRTTSRAKPLMIGRLRTLLAHELTIHSPLLQTQLSTFIEHENGTLGAQDGCEDDTVMALACAAIGLEPAGVLAKAADSRREKRRARNPFYFDTILEEMSGRGRKFPIKPQHAQ